VSNKIDKSTHLQNALNIALEREKNAVSFYSEGAARVTDAGVKTLFSELAEEEKHHVRRKRLNAKSCRRCRHTNPIRVGIDLQARLAQEADQGAAHSFGQLNCQAGGPRNRGQNGDLGAQGL